MAFLWAMAREFAARRARQPMNAGSWGGAGAQRSALA
jgi:hypothetical protein